jgi:cyclopropane fatty-acyl-phospholipid synthase-like methyltransferase
VRVGDPRKRAVRAGYDAIADRYLAWGRLVCGDPRARFLDELLRRLPAGARVLDLGCGAGMPSTAALAERCEVVGVDISEQQLVRARTNVPDATFLHEDFADLELPAESYDAVTAFYSVSHVPRDEHAQLFERIAGWLVPGGWFLASLGVDDSPDVTQEWLGVPMFFSSHPTETNRALVRTAGLELVLDEVVSMVEP